MCIYVCIYVFIYIRMYVYICMCIYSYMNTPTHIYSYMNTPTHPHPRPHPHPQTHPPTPTPTPTHNSNTLEYGQRGGAGFSYIDPFRDRGEEVLHIRYIRYIIALLVVGGATVHLIRYAYTSCATHTPHMLHTLRRQERRTT